MQNVTRYPMAESLASDNACKAFETRRRKDGRVGGGHGMRGIKPMTATSPPLVKPDMQISRIRLSQDVLGRMR